MLKLGIRRRLAFGYWLLLVCWRHARGRWFILRDVPMWACLVMSAAEGKHEIGDLALEEYDSRKLRIDKLFLSLRHPTPESTAEDFNAASRQLDAINELFEPTRKKIK